MLTLSLWEVSTCIRPCEGGGGGGGGEGVHRSPSLIFNIAGAVPEKNIMGSSFVGWLSHAQSPSHMVSGWGGGGDQRIHPLGFTH